jgi:hypothetical protein
MTCGFPVSPLLESFREDRTTDEATISEDVSLTAQWAVDAY